MQVSFNEVINQLVIMMFIIAVGFAAKKYKVLTTEGDKTLSSLVVNITAPALIISSMSIPVDGEIAANIVIIALLTVAILAFSYLASSIIFKIKGLSDEERVISRFCIIFGNVSFLGFPMCYGLFGTTGLLYASIYSAVQDIFFWSVGIDIMAGKTRDGRMKSLINPCMIAIAVGIILITFKLPLPYLVSTSLASVGGATIPLALMLVGSGFYHLNFDMESFRGILYPSVLKLAVIPAVVGAGLFMLNIDPVVKYVLLIEIAMPCAASTVVLARNYDRDHGLASKTVMAMTTLSILTIPLIILVVRSLWQ